MQYDAYQSVYVTCIVMILFLCRLRFLTTSEMSTSVVKWNEVKWSGGKVLGRGCLSLLEDTQTKLSFTASFIFCWFSFLIIKPTRCKHFSNLFLEWNSACFGQFLCPSSGVFQCTHGNGICHTGLLTACSQAVSKHVWHIPLPCVQWKLQMMDRGTVRNM